MLHTLIIYLNQFSQQNYFKIPKVSEYSPKFPIFPQNSQYSRWKFTALKIPGNFASLGVGISAYNKNKFLILLYTTVNSLQLWVSMVPG